MNNLSDLRDEIENNFPTIDPQELNIVLTT